MSTVQDVTRREMIASYGVVGAPPEPDLEGLVQLAATVCGVAPAPVASAAASAPAPVPAWPLAAGVPHTALTPWAVAARLLQPGLEGDLFFVDSGTVIKVHIIASTV